MTKGRRYFGGRACMGSWAGFRCQLRYSATSGILDPLTSEIKPLEDPKRKKIVLGLLSLVVGIILAGFAGVRVLQPLGVATAVWVDVFTTALVVRAGTEGLNSVVEFIEHGKEDKKADAETKKAEAEIKKAEAKSVHS